MIQRAGGQAFRAFLFCLYQTGQHGLLDALVPGWRTTGSAEKDPFAGQRGQGYVSFVSDLCRCVCLVDLFPYCYIHLQPAGTHLPPSAYP